MKPIPTGAQGSVVPFVRRSARGARSTGPVSATPATDRARTCWCSTLHAPTRRVCAVPDSPLDPITLTPAFRKRLTRRSRPASGHLCFRRAISRSGLTRSKETTTHYPFRRLSRAGHHRPPGPSFCRPRPAGLALYTPKQRLLSSADPAGPEPVTHPSRMDRLGGHRPDSRQDTQQ